MPVPQRSCLHSFLGEPGPERADDQPKVTQEFGQELRTSPKPRLAQSPRISSQGGSSAHVSQGPGGNLTCPHPAITQSEGGATRALRSAPSTAAQQELSLWRPGPHPRNLTP